MATYLVKLGPDTGQTRHNGVNAMIVFADDETDALDFAKAAYPGLAVWKDAEVIDLSALEAGDDQAEPPVDPAEGVYQRFVLA